MKIMTTHQMPILINFIWLMEPVDAGYKLEEKAFHDALFQGLNTGVTLICSQKVFYGAEDARLSGDNNMKFAHPKEQFFPSRCGETCLT